MCGIFFSLSWRHPMVPENDAIVKLRNRGPDSHHILQYALPHRGNMLHLTFLSTVLSLRGAEIISQPLVSKDGRYVLCWNGEAWKVSGVPIHRDNDATTIIQSLNDLTDSNDTNSIERYFASIEGPFAFVLYDVYSSTIYFGRDIIGRRSLVLQHSEAGDLTVSSVITSAKDISWSEVSLGGIHKILLRNDAKLVCDGRTQLEFRSWESLLNRYHAKQSIHNESKPSLDYDTTPSEGTAGGMDKNLAQGRLLLLKSLSLRLDGIPWIRIEEESPRDIPHYLSSNSWERVGILYSGGLDCSLLARLCHDIIPLDETIVLLNVAFENPRIAKQRQTVDQNEISIFELCPDRVTARRSLAELERTCIGRKWRLATINVPFKDSESCREQIKSLISPHDTEMDMSIAMALYFASRGHGLVEEANMDCSYFSSIRVLISGLGADEMFGGYIRHENAYKHGGMSALAQELELDINRIGERNLGRDDRVMAHWAREIRYPYLDEEFMQWALALPAQSKCAFHVTDSNREGGLDPGKYLLRRLANDIGLVQVAKEKKRAIQFGSRSAKMLQKKTKGNDSLL